MPSDHIPFIIKISDEFPDEYSIHNVPELHDSRVFPSDSNWIVVVYHFNTKTWWNDQGAMSFGVEAYGAWIQQPTFIDSDAMAGLS
jgi:hypothetical protein